MYNFDVKEFQSVCGLVSHSELSVAREVAERSPLAAPYFYEWWKEGRDNEAFLFLASQYVGLIHQYLQVVDKLEGLQ